MKSFVLKLIISFSIMASIAYLSIQHAQSAPVSDDVQLWDSCLDLRASIVELFLTLYIASELKTVVTGYIPIYNRGVQVFNEMCTPMMNPLEEIPS